MDGTSGNDGATGGAEPRAATPVPPRVVLALGGGAARGWSHLGVLQALQEAGIRPWGVAGTSIGSLVGAVWASGNLAPFREAVLELDRRRLWTFLDVVLPRSGLVDGRKVQELLREFVTAGDIREMPRPFAAVATDLATGREVVLREGDPVEAVRASIAVPGLFTPVMRDDRALVDGGLVNPVPVNVARSLGADLVIAVDIQHRILEDGAFWIPTGRAPSLREVLLSTAAIEEVTIGDLRLRIDPPDLLIRPRVGHVGFLEFARGPEAVEAGYEAAREALAAWPRREEVTGKAA